MTVFKQSAIKTCQNHIYNLHSHWPGDFLALKMATAPMAPWCVQALAECGELQCRDHGLWSRWGCHLSHDACDLTWGFMRFYHGFKWSLPPYRDLMGISWGFWGYSKLWLGDRDTTTWYNLLKWGYLVIWEYNRLTMRIRGRDVMGIQWGYNPMVTKLLNCWLITN